MAPTLLGLEDVHTDVVNALRQQFPRVAKLLENTDSLGLGEASREWLSGTHFIQTLDRCGTVFLVRRGQPVAVITMATMKELGITGTPLLDIPLGDFQRSSKTYLRATGCFVSVINDGRQGHHLATLLPLAFYDLSQPCGPKWKEGIPHLLVKEDIGLYDIPIPLPEPPTRRQPAEVTPPRPQSSRVEVDELTALLMEITVLEPELRDPRAMDVSNWPEGNWAVTDETSIIASFTMPEYADIFRLSLVNNRLNGKKLAEKRDKNTKE